MEIDKDKVLEYLNSDEGKELAEELKAPVVSSKNTILEEKKELAAKLQSYQEAEKQREQEEAKRLKQASEKKMQEENDFEAFKSHMQKEISEKENTIKAMQSKYARTEVDRLITQEASTHSQTPRPLQLLLKERVKPKVLEDGSVGYEVTDVDGQTLYWEGQPATIGHLVEQLKSDEQYSPFFAASGVSGSGSKATDTISQGSKEFNLTKAMGNKI